MDLLKPNQSNIVSLEFRRKARDEMARKEYLNPEIRIKELEGDMLRAIDYMMDLEQRLYSQEKTLRKLIHLLGKSVD